MPGYRAILPIVIVLSFFSIAGISEISVWLAITVTILSLAMWILPRTDKWNEQRNAHRRKGERQLQVGNYSEAERELALAAADAERCRKSATGRATILRNLAESQQKQGKLAQAEQSTRQAMALVSDPKPQSRAQYAQCLEALAGVCEDQKNYPQAQQILQESLNLEEGLPKPNPELLARRRQKLALAYHHAGDYSAASPHFARSLELHEQAFGPEHAETGKMLTELGTALQREGNHPEALRTLERALEIQKKTLSADAPEVTQSLYHLALAYEHSGNLDQAAAQLERIIRLRNRQVASEKELADALLQLSRVCLSLGRLARAEEAAQSAIPILERGPGPQLASAFDTLAAIYDRAGRCEEAAAARQHASEHGRQVSA